MKSALLVIIAIASSFTVPLQAQQQSNSLRSEWKIERGSAGYKTDNTPGKEEYNEAMNYYLGINNQKRDYDKAIKILSISAEKGNPLALYQLGNCYCYGNGVKINKKTAAEYWQKSSDLNCQEAKYELGNLYFNGDGVKRNYGKAVRLFDESAQSGNHAALYMLGVCYYEGKGVERDKQKGLDYWSKSAAKGNHKAKEKLKKHKK